MSEREFNSIGTLCWQKFEMILFKKTIALLIDITLDKFNRYPCLTVQISSQKSLNLDKEKGIPRGNNRYNEGDLNPYCLKKAYATS